MKNEYEDVYKQADELRYKFRDYVDAPNDPLAVDLYTEINRLAEEIEEQKNPHSLEDIAKRLIEEIRRANSGSTPIMDPRHLNELRDRLEDIRNDLRKLPNY